LHFSWFSTAFQDDVILHVMVSFIEILDTIVIVLLNNLTLQPYDLIYRQTCREIGFSYMLKGSKTDRYNIKWIKLNYFNRR
jgi:hypothetical protein